MNPLWQQKKLRKFCEEKGIHVTAYSPLGAKGTLWGTDQVMECEILKEIAKSKGKTLAQVCLRWVYEQGVSALVKSFNKERMRQNLEILVGGVGGRNRGDAFGGFSAAVSSVGLWSPAGSSLERIVVLLNGIWDSTKSCVAPLLSGRLFWFPTGGLSLSLVNWWLGASVRCFSGFRLRSAMVAADGGGLWCWAFGRRRSVAVVAEVCVGL
ncbi:hypothetical protein RHGRI_001328 [Rhododendron griersonianum]|uniref:NADP-dependent oxidoreductase domain-containing protein n=1 Tax=Rhododendron griersonianum TaxID=479676 RepID=A0AAV6LMX5_9ERIC|nr:hypothetical protein RHGRI_001328 [Rhododendron griersonianum]